MKNIKSTPDKADDLRIEAEKLLQDKSSSSAGLSANQDLHQLVHELEVHQIELEMQNEELRGTREEYEAGLKRYTDLYEFGPVCYFTIGRDTTIHQVNLTGSCLLGTERSRLVNRRFGDFLSDENRLAFDAFLERVFESKVKQSCEVALLAKGHRPLYVHIQAMAIDDGRECLAAVVDITERKIAEESLRASEVKYRRLHESMIDAFASVDMTGRILEFNSAFRDMLGYSEEDLFRMTCQGITPEKWHAVEARIIDEQILLRGYSEVYEKEYRKKDGTVFPVELRTYLLRDDTGQPVGMWAIARDISKYKQAETALRQSEERYRRITQAVTDYIVTVRVENGRAVETVHGSACEAVTGYSSDDFRNDPTLWIRMVHKEEHEAVCQQVERVLTGENPGPLEHRIWRKDGVLRWVRNTTVPHYDSQGRLLSYDSLIQDINERKQAEADTERLRNLLRNIIDSMPSILIGVDREGRVTTWNGEAQRATGISDWEAVGRPLEAVLPQIADQTEKVRAAIRERRMQKSERAKYMKDGEMKYMNVVAYPLLGDREGEGVIRIDDVTQSVRLEELMVQSEKMRVVGGLAAGMAHEINNPLGAIMQAAQNIQRRTSTGLAKNDEVAGQCNTTLEAVQSYLQRRGVMDMLEDIRNSGARAARIVTNMLQFSRRDEAELTPARLSDLIERAIELAINDYDLKKQYDCRNIEIVRDFDAGLPDVPCRDSEIEQVLLNLLKNSAQAMAEEKDLSSPRIIVRTRREGAMARIEVEDNGPGMTEQVRTRVFEPLFTTKQVGMGTGLGLAVAFMIIVSTHKGTISVESEPGAGTKFIIGLPLAKSGT